MRGRIGRALFGMVLALSLSAAGASAATLGPSQEQVDRALGAYERGEARVVKLRGERPSWFTPAVQRKLSRQKVMAAPVDAPLPGEIGIRPGSWMIAPYWCTMNYIFRNGGTLAIGTAGHCLESGQPVVLLTLAPSGGNAVLVQLGRVLLKRDGGVGKDYGLVEIPTSRRNWVFPTIAGVGGPCNVYYGGAAKTVAHYGHGVVVGTGGTPRAGVGLEVARSGWLQLDWDADSYAWAGLLAGGDSGSPVRIGELKAVGNLTHGLAVTGLEPSVIGWGTRISTITSLGWTPVNSPLC